MKEYKVVKIRMSLTKFNEKLENILNTHAREGWRFIQFSSNYSAVVLERDKNR